jgi:hypothetical protein
MQDCHLIVEMPFEFEFKSGITACCLENCFEIYADIQYISKEDTSPRKRGEEEIDDTVFSSFSAHQVVTCMSRKVWEISSHQGRGPAMRRMLR